MVHLLVWVQRKSLAFNSKSRISSGRFDNDLLKMVNVGIGRAGRKIVFEFLNSLRWPLRKRLDTPIFQISDVSQNLMPRGRTHRKIAKSDALNFTAYYKLTSNRHDDRITNFFRISPAAVSTSQLNQEHQGTQSTAAAGRCRPAFPER